MRLMPKLRYAIKEIFGDYYYYEMSEDEAIQKMIVVNKDPNTILKSKEQIDWFVQDNINIKMPLDGPLVRIYCQEYEENGEKKAILINKSHHSLCDGISGMCMTLAMSEEYDPSYFVKTREASWLEELTAQLFFAFQIPQVLMHMFPKRMPQNFIT